MDTSLAVQIGKRLRVAREEVQLTQEEMGARLGIGRAGYANIETGRSLISVDHLLKLPGILHKPVTYFLGDNGPAADEAELLQLYRAIPAGIAREHILDMVKSLAQRYRER